MHRFFVAPEQCRSRPLVLSGREAHHALRVVRVRRGDQISILDGAGLELLCEVAATTRDTVRLSVLERRSAPPSPYRITLIQAVPKGRLLESIIQKATELGVSRLVPLLTERVVLHCASGDASSRAQRWRAVAVEAIKQCGSPWLPQIDEPVSPQQLFQCQQAFDLALIASLQPAARHPRTWFQAFHARHNRSPHSVCIWVGPEGDFTPTESESIQNAGALPITLGPRILRTETAAVYCLSIVNYELGSGVNSAGGSG
jgi:16S rRNA (uracil1498-N3)-methyltransferase